MNFVDNFASSLNRRLDPPVKKHLTKVYSTLTISVLSACLGGYVHLYTNLERSIGGFLNFIIMSGLLIALYSTPDNGKNRNQRLGYLLGFAFFTGFGMGPLIENTLYVKASILPTALLSTAFIFACFSMSAIFCERRRTLYLGGLLFSGLSLLVYMSIFNIFFNSYAVYKAYIYLGFVIMCGFVVYDTAFIIEKRIHGDTDYISHSVLLFMDFASIFRDLLVLLTDKERQNNKRKKN